jgi:hypothetical protein
VNASAVAALPLLGVYVTVPPLFTTAVPLAGVPTPLTVNVSPFGSLQLASTFTVTEAETWLRRTSLATGASLIKKTVTVADDVPPCPSLIVYVNWSWCGLAPELGV